MPVVLYGCGTWSVITREKHRRRVFENRMLRKIFGSKRDQVAGEWRTMLYDELNDLYCSTNIIRATKRRRMRWAGHVACMGDWRGGET